MKEYGYFPGCSLEHSSREYEQANQWVCKQLDVKLKEIPDWSCCGSHIAYHVNHDLSNALSARNLSIAVKNKCSEVVAPCPACFNRLKAAQVELQDNDTLKSKLKKELDFTYDPQMKVSSLLELLAGLEPQKIKEKVKVKLDGLKMVAYYGCLLVRPPKLAQFDNPENPQSMDKLMEAAGVKMLQWDYKVQCCGASTGVSNPEYHAKLSGDILEMATKAGAQAVVVACPLCHVNLDLKQRQINQNRGSRFNIPIFYFTQILGLAYGATPKEMGIEKHLVDAMPLLESIGIK